MPEHQTLLWLPDALRDAGIPFAELHGWKANQPGYYWTNEESIHFGYNGDPVGWAWHHTATSGFTPYVKNSQGQTKANLFMGLARGNRLYQLGNGLPTTVFSSGGPGNFTEGKGRREVLNLVAQDQIFHGPQTNPDNVPNFYGNRHYGSTETVHNGDGSPLHEGVWEMQIKVAALITAHYGWSEFRNIGHLDHTVRKVDQKFKQGSPYTIGYMQELLAPDTDEEDDMNYRNILDRIGPGKLEELRQAGRWSGTTAYYFDGRSDEVEGIGPGTNQFLVEALIASDQIASLEPGPKGDPGEDGEDGEDSIVPGPKGEDSTVPGPKGDPGPNPTSAIFTY